MIWSVHVSNWGWELGIVVVAERTHKARRSIRVTDVDDGVLLLGEGRA